MHEKDLMHVFPDIKIAIRIKPQRAIIIKLESPDAPKLMSRSFTGNCQRISLNYCNKNNIVGKHEPFESAADSYRSVLCNPQRARDNARTHNDSAFRDIPLFWPKHWHWSIVDPLLTIYRLLGCYIEGLPSFFEKMWLSI